MVKYDFIKKLERDGDLVTAVRMGVVSTTVSRGGVAETQHHPAAKSGVLSNGW